MPFAGYANHAECVERNRDKDDPDAYCASIMREVEGKSKSDEGYSVSELSEDARTVWRKAFEEAIEKNDEDASGKIAWAAVMRRFERTPIGKWVPLKAFDDIKFKSLFKQDRVIYGAASVAVVDSDNELITENALKSAFDSYIKRGHVLFYHKNIPVGDVIPSYLAPDGKQLRSEVSEGQLNVVVRIYKDTKKADEVWEAIERGELRAFSIGGEVLGDMVKVCPDGDRERCYDRIDKIDLHEISIVPNPANDASYFTVIKSKVEAMTEPTGASKESPETEKLRKLEVLINDEKTKAVNCPKFTEKANEIISGVSENMPTKLDLTELQALKDAIVKEVVEAIKKEEHQADCPEGQHMVDGECVPMMEEKKGDAKMTEEKKTDTVEAKQEPAPAPAPTEKKTEIDAVRSEIDELREALTIIPQLTKEIAGLNANLLHSPAAKESAETKIQSESPGEKVVFDPDGPAREMSDWSNSIDGAFDERMKRIASEYGGKKEPETSAPEPVAQPETHMESIRTEVATLAKSLKDTMSEIKGLREKNELDKVKTQVTEMKDTILAFQNEIRGLKDNYVKTPLAAPAAKRTVSQEALAAAAPSADEENVFVLEGGADFAKRMRKLQREWGVEVTQ